MARPRTILCIDDHRNALIGRKMLLENSGYEVLEATGGDEGLNLFRSHPVDAVVLDYQMPGMNGDVVAAKMKRIRSSVPIMLPSACDPPPENKLKSVDTFVPKSQEPKMLISTLQMLISTLQHLLNSQSRPFFSRWLDHWKDRNQTVKL
jgi:CheY-like chemotaxis protein